MLEVRQHLAPVHEATQHVARVHARLHQLQRRALAQLAPRAHREVHRAHAAGAELALDPPAADLPPFHGGGTQERVLLVSERLLDQRPQHAVAVALGVQEGRPLVRLHAGATLEYVEHLDQLPFERTTDAGLGG